MTLAEWKELVDTIGWTVFYVGAGLRMLWVWSAHFLPGARP